MIDNLQTKRQTADKNVTPLLNHVLEVRCGNQKLFLYDRYSPSSYILWFSIVNANAHRTPVTLVHNLTSPNTTSCVHLQLAVALADYANVLAAPTRDFEALLSGNYKYRVGLRCSVRGYQAPDHI